MPHVYFQTLLSKFASSSVNLKNKTEKCCRRPLAPNQPLLSNSQQAEDCTATVAITGNCACVRVRVCVVRDVRPLGGRQQWIEKETSRDVCW